MLTHFIPRGLFSTPCTLSFHGEHLHVSFAFLAKEETANFVFTSNLVHFIAVLISRSGIGEIPEMVFNLKRETLCVAPPPLILFQSV